MIGLGSRSSNESGIRTHNVLVSSSGDTAARRCVVRIKMGDIERRDMQGLPTEDTRYNVLNFTDTIRSELVWTDGQKELTIRSGDNAEVGVMRFVPEVDGVPAHFEVPSERGWNLLSARLRLSTLYMTVRVVPLNGRPIEKRFQTRRRNKGEWTFGFFA